MRKRENGVRKRESGVKNRESGVRKEGAWGEKREKRMTMKG